MLKEILAELYDRDIEKVKAEISQYENDADLWKVSDDITNSAGNLALHIAGNLKHFFGAVLGETGFVRDRDGEFSRTGVSKRDIIADLDAAAAAVSLTLEKLSEADLEKTYPIEVFGKPQNIGSLLTHLSTHLNYHLGQINYHRRLLSGK